MAIQDIVQNSTDYLNGFFSGILSKLIIALLILLVGFIIGRIVGRVVGRLLHEIELDNILSKAGFKMPLEHTLATLLSYLIYFIAVVMTLNQLGLTTVALYIIVGGAVVLIIIATALGIKDFIPNIIAGIFIYRKGFIHEGQRIIIKNIEGKVSKISIIETELETKSGDRIFVPNSLIVKSTLIVKKAKN
ncbi:MAG TPA: mechanosensitive ion channel domain-containing protein [Candidatus Nanoarchaeia archaeon]|nr:mechanosensitive ion channel domain-containing protein [Candidatus Nanoarchaeia archaeon]